MVRLGLRSSWPVECAGPGIGEGHLFFYPDEKENQKVTQYLNAKAGSEALANLIGEAARRAILVRLPLLSPRPVVVRGNRG